jgi:hypothetical protein
MKSHGGATPLNTNKGWSAMELNQNKELIRRWIAFANASFAGRFDEFIAHGYIGHLRARDMDRSEWNVLNRNFARHFRTRTNPLMI